MLASSAIPGVFPAIERDGCRYYDGGPVTNVPVLEALAMGAKPLVVLDSAFADHRPRRRPGLYRTLEADREAELPG